MSDALPLPPRPDLKQYKTLAKELVRAHESNEVPAWARRWLESLARHVNMEQSPSIGAVIDGGVDWLARHWKQRPGGLAEAQLLIARAHGFKSWTKFAKHVESLGSDEGSAYERAADAIVEGDIETLRELLGERPGLVHERSARDHHSTLLHYAAANGIEDFRQKTPPNVVEIAALLLDAGADVNAESDAYAGRSTTLGLAATSMHPEKAGVQIALLELLLDRGATLDGPDGRVNACLANGRAMAAEYLARRGAKVDLEGAAGLGWIGAVQELFAKGVTHDTLIGAFGWACQFGRTEVVTFLLDHGMHVEEHMRYHEQTGLHWAAYEGYAQTVKLLLDRGAPVHVIEKQFDATPLDWALWGWSHIDAEVVAERQHPEAVALLVRAGAKLNLDWYKDVPELVEKARADARMGRALTGELSTG